ncbi:hypothetical protein KY290_015441 [Solanum tuberosum]|uniref:Amino acid transporter transmembrane domain-containing protein n=1 Tax=Solanum tuberosum TaxID=4113 RepID=A0ABQ7VSK6_SOLTU|nr:hypothetical protein KY284_022811 [Solanum tuberosum]KAH0718785.1 hypothetical protein KY285_014816 [Solanum tuberosum]KAH0771460.1 hypothetical protein KY290_015441 [Solanum tuberosum]
MTIGSIRPVKEKKSRKNKQPVVDDQSPLLPTKHQEDGFNGASYSGAVFNLSTTIVGAGIMALPATMKVLGLIPGIIMIILMAFLTEASVELLIRFSRTSNSVSYGGLMGDAFGNYGKMLLQICILVNNIGVLIWNPPCWCPGRLVRSSLVEWTILCSSCDHPWRICTISLLKAYRFIEIYIYIISRPGYCISGRNCGNHHIQADKWINS